MKGQVHTQSIDGLWGRLKAWLRSKHGVQRYKLPGHVAEYEWRHRQHRPNIFEDLLQAIGTAPWLDWEEDTRAGKKDVDEEALESDLDFEAVAEE